MVDTSVSAKHSPSDGGGPLRAGHARATYCCQPLRRGIGGMGGGRAAGRSPEAPAFANDGGQRSGKSNDLIHPWTCLPLAARSKRWIGSPPMATHPPTHHPPYQHRYLVLTTFSGGSGTGGKRHDPRLPAADRNTGILLQTTAAALPLMSWHYRFPTKWLTPASLQSTPLPTAADPYALATHEQPIVANHCAGG